MTIARLSLASNIESRVASTSKDSRLVNAIVETKSGVKQIVKRHGTQVLNISPALEIAQGQGLFFWNSYLIAGIHNIVYLIAGQNTSSVLGTVVGDTVPFSFTSVANDDKLAFHNGSNLYTINKGTPPTFVGGVGLTGVVDSVYIATPNRGGYYGYDTACTITVGATTTVAKTGHGLVAGQGVQFNGTLPTGMVAGTTYQVVYVDANSFTINTVTTGGGVGSAVATSGTSSGVTYQASPTVTFGTSPGTTAKGTVLIFNHQVSEVILTVQGAGYTSTPTVTFSAPTAGTTAAGYFSDPYNNIYATITNPGSGYLVAPTCYGSVYGAGPQTVGINSSGQVSYTIFAHGPIRNSPVEPLIYSAPPSETATGTAVMASGGITGPFAAGLAYLNGKCYVMGLEGNVYHSDTDNPAIWSGDHLNASSDPDGGVALVRHLNYLLAFGQWSTECLYDAGNPTGSPLAVNQSAKLEIGCAAGYSVAKAEQTVLWVGQGLTEGRGVFLMDGMSPVRVSTRYIEKYLNADDMARVSSYCMKLSGHTLYVLTLHTSNITLVYDLDEKEWYQWTSIIPTNTLLSINNGNDLILNSFGQFNSLRVGDVISFNSITPGTFTITLTTNTPYYVHSITTDPFGNNGFKISATPGGVPLTFGPLGQTGFVDADVNIEQYFSLTFFNGNIEYQSALYALGDDDGKVYKLDSSYTSDNEESIYFRTVLPIVDSGTTKRKFYRRVEVIGDKINGNAYIRYYNDDYTTASAWRTIPLINERPQAFQFGSGRRRAWEILVTDNIPIRLDALEVDFDIGRMEGAQV